MSIQSTKELKVSDLIANLNTRSITVEDSLSNAQKSAERVEWFALAIRENRLTDFLQTVEQTIDALPEGTEVIPTIHPVTGKKGSKKVNQRDIAKNSYKRAFIHASKETPFADKVLTFKLSKPQLDDKKAPKGFEDKVASLLKETVDSAGLKKIMATIEKEQERHLAEVKEQAAQVAAVQLKDSILRDLAENMRREGMTVEKAQTIVSLYYDMEVAELQAAIQ